VSEKLYRCSWCGAGPFYERVGPLPLSGLRHNLKALADHLRGCGKAKIGILRQRLIRFEPLQIRH